MKKIYEVWINHNEKGSNVMGPETPPEGHYFLIQKQELDKILSKCMDTLKDLGLLVSLCTDEIRSQIPDELRIGDQTYWRDDVYLAKEEGVVQIRFITIDKAHNEGRI